MGGTGKIRVCSMALCTGYAEACAGVGSMLDMAARGWRSRTAGVVAGAAGRLAVTDPDGGSYGTAVSWPVAVAVGAAGGIVIADRSDGSSGPGRPDIGVAEEGCAVERAALNIRYRVESLEGILVNRKAHFQNPVAYPSRGESPVVCGVVARVACDLYFIVFGMGAVVRRRAAERIGNLVMHHGRLAYREIAADLVPVAVPANSGDGAERRIVRMAKGTVP